MTSEEILAELLNEQREMNRWLKLIALPSLRSSLQEALQKPEELRVYQASDGRAVREVSDSADVAFGTVVNYWKRWSKAGLVLETAVKGRYQRLVDLGDVGIEVEEVHGGKSRYGKRNKNNTTED